MNRLQLNKRISQFSCFWDHKLLWFNVFCFQAYLSVYRVVFFILAIYVFNTGYIKSFHGCVFMLYLMIALCITFLNIFHKYIFSIVVFINNIIIGYIFVNFVVSDFIDFQIKYDCLFFKQTMFFNICFSLLLFNYHRSIIKIKTRAV